MPKEELVVGLRNAVARGESLENAMQSFVNAGYNPQEVQEAAGEVQSGMGVTGALYNEHNDYNEQIIPASAQQTLQKEPKSRKWKIIIIIIIAILIVLLGVLGAILFVF